MAHIPAVDSRQQVIFSVPVCRVADTDQHQCSHNMCLQGVLPLLILAPGPVTYSTHAMSGFQLHFGSLSSQENVDWCRVIVVLR